MGNYYKRYCKILSLKDDPEMIKQYRKAHEINKAWPEITKGMKEVGIIDMEIYIHGNTLFMIMDTIEGFDHEKSMAALAAKPRQREWERYVSKFQNVGKDADAGTKWTLMERIYELGQEKEFDTIQGQMKKFLG